MNTKVWIVIGIVLVLAMALLLWFSLGSKTKTVDQTTLSCGETSIHLEYVEKTHLGGSEHTLGIKIDGLPIIELRERQTVDLMPYKDEVYGDAPRYYFKLLDTVSDKFKGIFHRSAMLYMDPKKIDRSDFEKIRKVMESCNEEILLWEAKHIRLYKYYIAGIVYGKEESFRIKYKKADDDYFLIYPNGWIIRKSHTLDDVMVGEITAPGNTLEFDQGYGPWKKEELRDYRNEKTDRTMDLDFEIVINK